MKIISASFLFLTLLISSVYADSISNPLNNFATRYGLTGVDQIKKIEKDITGDGALDILLTYVDPSPNIEERRVVATGDRRLSWSVYIKNADGSYSRPSGLDLGGGDIRIVASIAFDPLETYVGSVSEINKFALLAREKQTPRRAAALSIIWAFTWEGGTLKQHKLGEFQTGQQNTLFEKYLKDGKRTVLQVQQVTP